ncbi:PD-(D/E)XK nuclease-like domain-containing protein [Achromobacter sp.]|uniref:PD-(D/E)XK nuclease-like domain-containing protein n=1 Tax=Achromobacter sp. TaxID=134375 RepID=UPI000EDABB35|nr:PD-(D/E)XK nuclease-like domain-containing protein [Achromobacter sp.]HCW17718.1 exonuclease VIII [Achromobacter sp.]
MNTIPARTYPAIVHGLDIEAYHAGIELSKTGLDDLARSPEIFRALRAPGAPARPRTAAQLHGHLGHCAILEHAEFAKRYSVHPCMNRNTKAWHAIEAAAAPGVQPIQQDQYDTAMSQRESVLNLTNVYGSLSMAEILGSGWAEPSAYWVDPDTGVRCRCRPDFVHPLNKRQAILVDVKTFGDAGVREFSKQVSRTRYHVQDAFYSEGFARAAGLEVVAFIFVVVEDKFPHASASYQLGNDSRYEGYSEVRRLLDVYAECERTGVWPGYARQTTVVDMPAYALTSQEIEISYA